MEFDAYKELAIAIVMTAIKDFKKAAKRYKAGIEKESNLKVMKEVVSFVKSDWFTTLTDLEPQLVLKKLKEELI